MERKRILFVDDEASLRATLPEILRQSGFEVTAVGTVAEAIAAISQARFDVLLSDLNIGQPGDGFTVVSAMRRTQPEARSFILTGYPDFESALRAIRSQVDDYFVKPADPLKLIAALQEKLLHPPDIAHGPLKEVSQVLQELEPAVCSMFVRAVRDSRQLESAKLADDELASHIHGLLDELLSRLRNGLNELSAPALASAAEYGSRRRRRGYSLAMLMHEFHLLDRVISQCLQDNLLLIDMSTLIPDMIAIGESLNAYLEEAVRGFTEAAVTPR